VPEAPNSRPWSEEWRRLRQLLLHPTVDDQAVESALRSARARQPLPVVWLLGKAQSGKTSIIRALTGSPSAEIGNGFRPCTRTARLYDFPAEAPVVRFLDTRGLGEVAYDPAEDIRFCEAQAHLVLGVMKATDLGQEAVFEVLRAVRRRHPQWPMLIAQTGLHEGYPPGSGHILPYPFAHQPWPTAVPNDLTRALLAQRDGLGRLPGAAVPLWVPIDLILPEDGAQPGRTLWPGLDAARGLRVSRTLGPGRRRWLCGAPGWPGAGQARPLPGSNTRRRVGGHGQRGDHLCPGQGGRLLFRLNVDYERRFDIGCGSFVTTRSDWETTG
jgi:hypothetical protein